MRIQRAAVPGMTAILLLLALLVPMLAQNTRSRVRAFTDADWPRYTGDFAGTRYSKLKQINTTNVSKLAQVWTFAGVGGEQTPIVVDGVLYASTPAGVVALDADTGKQTWRYGAVPAPGGAGGRGGGGGRGGAGADGAAGAGQRGAAGGTAGGAAYSSRGVAYWPGDATRTPRILVMVGSRLLALHAATGQPDTAFGQAGFVETGVSWGGVPLVYKNVIVLGAANGEVTIGDSPGDTRAYDARTGDKLWNFVSVAQPGDQNHAAGWLDDGWKQRQGVNHWGWYFTADEQRDIIYTTFGSPAGNYWGGDRPGTNLYANSVVAVDANTGKYLWHFQSVHHDLWDSDQPAAPTLIDIKQNGRVIPALGLISKTAWLFILDRTKGRPIFGVEERPVPKGNAPGKWYSPTQPFPLKPPALARTSFKKEDIVTAEDTSPEHAKACMDAYERAGGFYNEGPFTPFLFHEAGTPPKSSIQFPGNGGTNWGGPAGDPQLGYIFSFTQDSALAGWIEAKVPGGNYGSGNGSPQPYDRGSVSGPGPYSGFAANGMPCQKPPWGRLTAVDANTGEFAWQVTLGVSDSLPAGKQNTGRGGSAGPIVTAGGLIFIGATSDSRFRAIDSKTGKELWVTRMNGNGSANPMTYQGKSGKQYVAQAAGGTLNVYALP
jgi:quinoprotein glucose dehydrogenase